MSNHYLIYSLIVSVVSMLFWGGVSAQNIRTLTQFQTQLFDELSLQPSARINTTVNSFCKIATQAPIQGDNMIYDASQSLWMSVLCLHTKNPAFNTINSLHAVKTQRDRDMRCDLLNNKDLEDCPLHRDIVNIFGIIINTYSNIKLAHLYGMSSLDDSLDEQTLANQWSKQYFGPEFELCGKDCQYPKTYNQLKATLSTARNNALNNQYISIKELAKQALCEPNQGKYDMIRCGLMTGGTTNYFTTLVYHELMRYQLFVATYSHVLSTSASISKLTPNALNSISKQADIINELNDELRISTKALSHTITTLNSIQQTYPVHVGLLMYYETLETFRDRLAKIYTPLHQLYYKLRNVQQKES